MPYRIDSYRQLLTLASLKLPQLISCLICLLLIGEAKGQTKSLAHEKTDSSMMTLNYHTFAALVAKAHPESRIDQLSLEIAQQNERVVGLPPDPQISIGKKGISSDSGSKTPGSSMSMSQAETMETLMISLSQSFPWPGTLAAEERVAESSTTIAVLDQSLSQLERSFFAKSLYLEMVGKHKIIQVDRQNLKEVEKFQRFAEASFKQGIGSHLDLLRTISESAILKGNIAALEAELDNLKSHAIILINMPFSASVDFELEFPETETIDGKPIMQANDGLAQDVVRKRIEAVKQSALAQKQESYQRSLPQFMVTGTMMQMESGEKTYEAMIAMGLPLYSWGQRNALSKQQDLLIAQANEQEQWHLRQKQLAIAQVKRRISSLKQNLKIMVEEVIPAAEEHLETAFVQYTQGKGNIDTIITSQQTILQQKLTEINLRKEIARTNLSLAQVLAGFSDYGINQSIPNLPLTLARSGMAGDMQTMDRSGTNQMEVKPKSPNRTTKPQPGRTNEPDTPVSRPSGMPGMGM